MLKLTLDDGFGKIVQSLREVKCESKTFDKDWFTIVGIAETFLDVQNNINNGFNMQDTMNPEMKNLLLRGLIESIYNLQDALDKLFIFIKNEKNTKMVTEDNKIIKDSPISQKKDNTEDLSLRKLRNTTVGHPMGATSIETNMIFYGFILTDIHGIIPDSVGITFRYYQFCKTENKQKSQNEVYITYKKIQEYLDKIQEIGIKYRSLNK